MQSRRAGNDNPVLPQVNHKNQLVRSASVDRKADALTLVKGNSLHQIFQTDKSIFNISSTFEKLYRYRFDPVTNDVVEIVVLKRVRPGDPVFGRLQNILPKKKSGTPTSYCNNTYEVYTLMYGGKLHGYMVYSKPLYGNNHSVGAERLYFAIETYEKKGGEC